MKGKNPQKKCILSVQDESVYFDYWPSSSLCLTFYRYQRFSYDDIDEEVAVTVEKAIELKNYLTKYIKYMKGVTK